jgi:hypothetical protein
MMVFFLYIGFKLNTLFTHIELKENLLIVYWKSGDKDEYNIPQMIKKIDFSNGFVWIDLDNNHKSVRISDSMFKEKEILRLWLSDNIPVVNAYKDGRIEKTTLFDEKPRKTLLK